MNLGDLVAENARLQAENAEFLTALKNVVKAEDEGEDALIALGVATYPGDHPVIAAARVLVGKAESLARDLAGHRPPRFFRETSTGMTWEWRNGAMTIDGEDSIFTSPSEILECMEVIEVDEFGRRLVDADAEAGERGDRDQQREADES